MAEDEKSTSDQDMGELKVSKTTHLRITKDFMMNLSGTQIGFSHLGKKEHVGAQISFRLVMKSLLMLPL